MVQSPATTGVIEKQVRIDARPELVYQYFTDPVRITSWLAPDVVADARPGGVLRLNYNGFDIARGEFVELTPPRRIVFTFGWETLGDAPPPGATTVEVDLEPDGAGTRLTLVHRGWTGTGSAAASEGWGQLLGALSDRVAGRGAAPKMDLTPGQAMASELNAKLIELRHALEGASPANMLALTSGEGWSAAATVYHTQQHCEAIRAIRGLLDGTPEEIERLGNERDSQNAAQAEQHRGNRADMLLQELLEMGPQSVDALRRLSDAELARTYPLGFLGGTELTVEQLAGALMRSLFDHIDNVKAAVA